MATLRDIKRRISGVKNMQQITKAMKMVSAARLRRAQENIFNARPYSRKIAEMLGYLLSLESDSENLLLQPRDTNNVAIIVVTSDRGLCGSFNMNIVKETNNLITAEYKKYLDENKLSLFCIGKKGLDYFLRRNYILAGQYSGIFSHLNFQVATELVKDITTKYLNKEIDKVVVVYNEFKSIIQQKIVVEQLLPIPEFKPENSDSKTFTDYIFEPDKKTIINKLLPKHLNSQLWRILLESYAAELGARMTAMDMATENAKELVRTLQIKYNKERQAGITKEILEIVSGANALKSE